MKTYDAFPSDSDYHNYLYRQDGRGRLPSTSVDDEVRGQMLGTVLADEPEDGVYMEVGPAVSPYCMDSPRDFGRLHYVGIDGGTSAYSSGRLERHKGWGEYGHIFTDDIQQLAQTMSDAPSMSRASFLWADAQKLPFVDGEQNTKLPIRETFMRDIIMTSVIHSRSVEAILREQARVLAKDGMLIIRETDTMRYHHIFGTGRHPDFLSLIANLELTGFTERVMLFDNEDGFHDLLRQYPGGDDDKQFNTGYYLICRQGERRPPESTWWQKVRTHLGRFAMI